MEGNENVEGNENTGVDRRQFLRRAAVAGAVAWAVPVIQTVAATPAFAQSAGSPAGGGCFHSLGLNGGCMPACTSVPGCTGNGCQIPCNTYCRVGQGANNPCCNPGLCQPSNFTCTGQGSSNVATYHGSLVGC